MKKTLISLAIGAIALLAASCEPQEKIQTISVNVSVDESEIGNIPAPESYDVSLTNFTTAEVTTVKSENKIATFTNVVPGVYKVTVAAITAEGGFNYTLSGAQDNVDLTVDGTTVNVKVAAAKESALLFKEIYYSGTGLQNGGDIAGTPTYFRDQFYEIYNNGNETVYMDGLCLAETYFTNYDFSIFYKYEVPGANAEDYVFAQRIWQFPGAGTDYPVKPGESIVVAQWATDHTDASLSKGSSIMNLKGAEFEALMKIGETWPGSGIVITDEQAANMTQVVNTTGYNMPQWLTSVSGTTYVLFRPSTPLRQDNFLAPINDEGTMSNVHEILIADIIDGVQAVGDETRLQTLGLPSVVDAGAIWCSGSYKGESISRKIKETREDGRVIYQDTNNTTNDFEVNPSPMVRRNNSGVPSWNTWIK